MEQEGVIEPVINYTFDQPDHIFDLPKELVEISGLSYHSKSNQLHALNDEEGKIFVISPEDGKVVSSKEILGLGDYEGITSWNDTSIIVKSKGDIFFYNHSTGASRKINTQLKKDNNIEGLCLDTKTNRLLLAGKGDPWNGQANQKAIYSYSLNDIEKSDVDIYHMINVDSLVSYYYQNHEKTNNIEDDQKINKRLSSFAPSSINIHPINQSIFITSSRGKSVVILNEDLSISDIKLLDKSKIEQPEGICFDAKGNLYLASEGKTTPGRIFVYEMK